MTRDPHELFAAALCGVLEELDWPLLGELYCHEGGEHFFDAERRAAILDGGLRHASDVGEALAALGSGAPPVSLYVGASVFELGPVLFEALVLGRAVEARNLSGRESAELGRAIDVVSGRMGVRLPELSTAPVGTEGDPVSHVWLVSVLTDPEAFPALHDELYERHGSELATGRGDLAADRARAEALIEALLSRARSPCIVTTSEDELPVWRAVCARAGRSLRTHCPTRASPVVGDVVSTFTLQ